MATTPGTRVKCTKCASEAIVLQANDLELSCCGERVEEIFVPDAPPAS